MLGMEDWMSVKFVWKGRAEDTEGLAVYATADSTYDVWLPTFKKAQQLDSVLRDVFADGRRIGHREMMRGVRNTMNDVARQL
jgi:hypothetical protein